MVTIVFEPMETKNNEKPRWYSIKEAAEYLDIGEPTIYRWMKEGKITYRKVGDSTRFFVEDLNSAVQMHPSAKDVEKVRLTCPICHHDELIEGRVRGTGLVHFQPRKTRFWTIRDSIIQTSCRMCTRCGGIFWYGDTEKLKTLRPKTDQEGAASATSSNPEAVD